MCSRSAKISQEVMQILRGVDIMTSNLERHELVVNFLPSALRSRVLTDYETSLGFKVDLQLLTLGMFKQYLSCIDDVSLEINFESARWKDCVQALSVARKRDDRKNERSVPNEHDLELSKVAFNCPFERPEISASLLKHAQSCLREWDQENFFSPYAAIHNASMMGKSRCVKELHRWGVFTINVSLQEEQSGNFPRRSPIIADFLTKASFKDGLHCEQIFSAILIETVNLLVEWITPLVTTLNLFELCFKWNEFHDSEAFWDKVLQRAAQYPQKLQTLFETKQTMYDSAATHSRETCKDAMRVSHDRLKGVLGQIDCSISTSLQTTYGIPANNRCVVLFFFDEARQLMASEYSIGGENRFQILRHAFQMFPDKSQGAFFAYVMDTVSKISNLAPSTRMEPSQRVREKGQRLFPPFWWLPTIDVWPNCRSFHTARQLSYLRCYSLFGRPGFHAIFAGIVSKKPTEPELCNTEEYMVSLLERKLVCAKRLSDISQLNQDQTLAVLGARTSLNVNAACRVASNLTASHMRMCVGVSDDRESVFTFQCAEPALAYAASRLTFRYGWRNQIDHLRDSMGATFSDAGFRGELGAQMLLLMACDQCAPKALGHHGSLENIRAAMLEETKIALIPLIDLLRILLGDNFEEYSSKNNLKQRTENMYVRVVQFVQMFCEPSLEKIIALFQRGAAVVSKFGAPFVDLLIPVIVAKSGQIPGDLVPGKDNMTVFLIQVKCLQNLPGDRQIAEICSHRLKRGNCTSGMNGSLDYVSLFIELGNHDIGNSMQVDGGDSEKAENSDSSQRKRGSNSSVGSVYTRYEIFKETGIHQNSRQISIVVFGLRPSNVLHPEDTDALLLDAAFSELMRALYDPLKLKNSSPDAFVNLRQSLELLYV